MEYQERVEQILLNNCMWHDTDAVRELAKDHPTEALAQVMDLLHTIGATDISVDGDTVSYTLESN